jgi:hypothetical protein
MSAARATAASVHQTIAEIDGEVWVNAARLDDSGYDGNTKRLLIDVVGMLNEIHGRSPFPVQ